MGSLGDPTPVSTPDGRELHAVVSGAGDPTVVLESGMGFSRSQWGLVAPAVAQRARVVAYDRAGLGRSAPDPRPRTLARLRDDLLAVVDALAPGPVVLAGHSWGGPIVRAAAARLGADRVRGVVVVDQSDEHCDMFFEPATRRRFAVMARTIGPLARLGLYRRMGSRPGRVLPPDAYADLLREDFSPAAAAGMRAELDTFLDELAALREDQPDLTGIPTTVVTGTQVPRGERKTRPAIGAAHRRTAAELPDGRLVEATRSGHLVPLTEPRLVADEILRLLGGRQPAAAG